MKGTCHNPKYNTRLSNCATDAVVVPKSAWKQIKRDAVHLTPQQRKEIREKEETAKLRQLEATKVKRDTFITPTISSEVTIHTRGILSTKETRDYALQVADQKAESEIDEVKTMDSIIAGANARFERDSQLAEHEEKKQHQAQEEKSFAELMETKRKAQCNLYDQREASLHDQRVRGRAILQKQIEEHKINSILEAERLDREQKALIAQNNAIREEEEKIANEKQQRKQAFLHDCLEAEAAAKRAKLANKQRDNDEAQMVIDFAAEKALREEALAKEMAATKALKEREISEIRSKQERAIDHQAIRDEQMARRVTEEKDEIERLKEEKEKDKATQMRKQIQNDQIEQTNAKRERLLKTSEIERSEYQRVLEANQVARQKAKEEYQSKLLFNEKYRKELGETVQKREEMTKIDPSKVRNEAVKTRAMQDEYTMKIEEIRQRKIQELQARGMPERYIDDVRNARFELK